MIPTALKFGANATDRVDCGSFTALGVPNAATWAGWFISTSQGVVGQRIAQKGNHYLTFANAANNRVDFETGRSTTFLRALAEASSFAVNWTTHLGTPVFIAGTYDIGASSLPRLYMGDLNTPAGEPSAYVTQTLGSGTVTDQSASNLLLGNNAVPNAPLNGSFFWFYAASAEYSLAEIRRLQFVPNQNYRACAGRWRLGANGRGPVLDDAGNRNHGTITGAFPTNDVLPRVGRRWAA